MLASPVLAADDSPPSTPAPAPSDAAAVQREVVFDIAFRALVAGDLFNAENAFAYAAGLGGDPAARAVAASFAARVHALRLARQAAVPPPGPVNPVAAAPLPSTAPAAAPVVATDNTGHIPFLLTTSLLGLGLYGWTLPGALGVRTGESPRTFVGLYMVGAASSFLLPFLATRGDDVSAGQANLAFWAGTRGAYLGQLMAALVAGDVSSSNQYSVFAGSLLVGSLLGLTTGTVLAERAKLSPGQAHTVGVGGDFGLGLGFGFAYLFGFNDDANSRDGQARRISASALLGTTAGLAGGYWLASDRDNTWGDAEVMRTSGLVGVLAGIAAADGFNARNRQTAVTIMVAGLAGTVIGDRLVARTSFSVGQSVLVDLSTAAGGLAAAGLLYLVSPRDWSERPFLVAATLGAAGGLTASYLMLDDRPTRVATEGAGRDADELHYSLLPMLGPGGVRGVTLGAGF
ncbi:MAG TPA: hypothetical protein VH374_00245 [Polyangia bacterium]|nr:hypothetical protein [Polyangia bacterium]